MEAGRSGHGPARAAAEKPILPNSTFAGWMFLASYADKLREAADEAGGTDDTL